MNEIQGTQATSRLSLERIEKASSFIDPAFLNSPQFISAPLSEHCGTKVVLKVETINPVRSFKGRGAELFVSGLGANTPQLVCASAGNFGQAIAYSARKKNLRTMVFAAQNANPLKIQQMRDLGVETRLGGRDFDEAKEFAQAFVQQRGGLFIEDGKEAAFAEGAGTIATELCRFPGGLNCILAPLGNGGLLAGIGRWVKAKSPKTRVIGVCVVGAPAMELSLREGRVVTTKEVATIADGIAVRVPVPEALNDLRPVVDQVLLVDDEALIQAMQLLFVYHGIVAEPAGVVGLAAILAHKHRFLNMTISTPICGGNLSPDRIRRWLVPAINL